MAADLSYKATVDVSQAEKNLSNLQKSVGGLNDTFIRLKSTLATISLSAIISSSIKFADAIQDLSDATGIATANILGFSNAVSENGGNAETAQKAILKLVQTIGDAAGGSLEAQNAFREVGISLGDLSKLSEQDLLKKTIDGLDKIGNSAERSALIAKLLGKEFRNVKFGELGTAYATAAAESQKYSGAIAAGAAAQQNLETTLKKFQIALLDSIKPFNEFIAGLNVSISAIKQFITAAIAVGAVVISITAVGRAFTLLRAAAVFVWELGAAFVGFLGKIKQIIVTLPEALAIIRGSSSPLRMFFDYIVAISQGLYTKLLPVIEAIKPAILPIGAAAAAVFGWMSETVDNLTAKTKSLIETLTFGLVKFGQAPQGSQADVRRVDNSLEEQATKDKNALREVQDALQKRRLEIQKSSTAFKRQNSELLTNIQFEGLLIGKTEDVIEVERARDEMAKRADDTIQGLRDAKKLLTKDEQALAAVYDQQIKKIEETYRVDVERVATAIEGLQGLRLVEKGRLQDIENTTKAIEDQISRQQALGDILRGLNDQRVDVRFQQAQRGKSPLERQIAEIRETARKGALEAGRSFAAAFNTEDGLTPDTARELASGLEQIARGYADIANQAILALGVTEEFANGNVSAIQAIQEQIRSGLISAWDEYKIKALDTAGQIKSSFENFTSGLEDAFVNFVQTGKLSFKSLANSILADLARIAFKKAVLGMAGLFGFAAGGSVMGGTPIVVGERGPELFVPSSAGKIVPNNVLNGSAAGQGAVNGGGQTMVTYNIQAVDASSFRSLVARDPSFIYAVTEQGRRSQPTRSR